MSSAVYPDTAMSSNPFENLRTSLSVDDQKYNYFDINKLNDERVNKLPYCIKVLLESAGKLTCQHQLFMIFAYKSFCRSVLTSVKSSGKKILF